MIVFHPVNREYIIEAVTEEMTDTGIVVPTHDHDTRPCFGRIVAVDNNEPESRKFQIGYVVYFDRFSAIQIDIREIRRYSVREGDIRGTVEL